MQWLKLLLGSSIKCNILSATESKKVTYDFNNFVESDFKKYNVKFQQFDRSKQHLEEWYFKVIQQKHELFDFVLKLILTLSHGKAAVDRSFSISKNILAQSIKLETIVARKIIKDHIPVGSYMFKGNNRNTITKCDICSELTIKTPERRHWRCSGVFIVNFEHISHLLLVFRRLGCCPKTQTRKY